MGAVPVGGRPAEGTCCRCNGDSALPAGGFQETLHQACAQAEGGIIFFFLPDKSPLLARTSTQQVGRACPLCPGTSDVDFLRNLKGVIDLNAQVSHRALDLRVAEQQLNRP